MGKLPDFLIIGAYKSGTTSLVEYLGQHPQIFLPWLQEPNYFAFEKDGDSTSRKTEIDWGSVYHRHRARTMLQYQTLFEDAPEGAVIGECSPEYMRSPFAAPRIQATLPDVKLIAILRNPIERAHSDYQAFVRDSIEHDDFGTAVRRPEGVEPGRQYVATGYYGRQLLPYFERFGKDRILVVFNEDLQHRGVETLRSVCDFLGVDGESFEPDVSQRRNVSGRPGSFAVSAAFRLRRNLRPWLKPITPAWAQRRADGLLAAGLKRESIEPEVREHLARVYKSDIELLETLIDRDLSAWLSTEKANEV